MVKHTLRTLGPKVLASRMLREYVTRLYMPAALSSRAVDADDFAVARDLAAWKKRVRAEWPALRIDHVEADGVGDAVMQGTPIDRARVRLARRPDAGRRRRAGRPRPGRRGRPADRSRCTRRWSRWRPTRATAGSTGSSIDARPQRPVRLHRAGPAAARRPRGLRGARPAGRAGAVGRPRGRRPALADAHRRPSAERTRVSGRWQREWPRGWLCGQCVEGQQAARRQRRPVPAGSGSASDSDGLPGRGVDDAGGTARPYGAPGSVKSHRRRRRHAGARGTTGRGSAGPRRRVPWLSPARNMPERPAVGAVPRRSRRSRARRARSRRDPSARRHAGACRRRSSAAGTRCAAAAGAAPGWRRPSGRTATAPSPSRTRRSRCPGSTRCCCPRWVRPNSSPPLIIGTPVDSRSVASRLRSCCCRTLVDRGVGRSRPRRRSWRTGCCRCRPGCPRGWPRCACAS